VVRPATVVRVIVVPHTWQDLALAGHSPDPVAGDHVPDDLLGQGENLAVQGAY